MSKLGDKDGVNKREDLGRGAGQLVCRRPTSLLRKAHTRCGRVD